MRRRFTNKVFELGTMICDDPGTLITCGHWYRAQKQFCELPDWLREQAKTGLKRRIASIHDGSMPIDYRSIK